MRRVPILLVSACAFIGVLALRAQPAAADDETDNVEIKIQAPLDAVDCTANTISVLGLTIDISTASIDSEQADASNQDGSGSDSGGDDGGGSSDGSGTGQGGCSALIAGQSVEVKLASDAAPLSATEVSQSGDDGIEIKAPVQSADATGQTITVLGLTVNVANANMGGDDHAGDDSGETVDLTQVMPGQFVEMQLDASQLPALVATELHVRNFTNQVEVEVDDSTGQQIDDTDDTGAPADDVEVEVDETVMVQNPATSTVRQRHVRKVIQLHTASNGSFVLSGLPTGRAKIRVSRTHNGTTTGGKRTVVVRPNVTRGVRVRLH